MNHGHGGGGGVDKKGKEKKNTSFILSVWKFELSSLRTYQFKENGCLAK
jgi:hypothetical protein